MRLVFGVLSLLIVVAVIGVVARKQLQASTSLPVPAAASSPLPLRDSTTQQVQQLQQVQQQMQDDVNKAMQDRARQLEAETK